MKKVMFWEVGDTVVSESEPKNTWSVRHVWESADKNRWVEIVDQKSLKINGREDYIQKLGFVGYRKISEPFAT